MVQKVISTPQRDGKDNNGEVTGDMKAGFFLLAG